MAKPSHSWWYLRDGTGEKGPNGGRYWLLETVVFITRFIRGLMPSEIVRGIGVYYFIRISKIRVMPISSKRDSLIDVFTIVFIVVSIVTLVWYWYVPFGFDCNVCYVILAVWRISDLFTGNVYYFLLRKYSGANRNQPRMKVFIYVPLAYAEMLLWFAVIYSAVGKFEISVLSGFYDSIYVSIVTITTLGYGDFRPANTVTKLACATEALLGVYIIGTLIAGGIWFFADRNIRRDLPGDLFDEDNDEYPRKCAQCGKELTKDDPETEAKEMYLVIDMINNIVVRLILHSKKCAGCREVTRATIQGKYKNGFQVADRIIVLKSVLSGQ